MNKWIGIGRICNDVEATTGKTGSAVAKFRIAVNREFKKEGQPDADFLNCVAFGKTAEFVQKYLYKGIKIAVEGRIQTGSYDKDGVRHYTTDIVVDRCEFCESKSASGGYEAEERKAIQNETTTDYTPVETEDLPF